MQLRFEFQAILRQRSFACPLDASFPVRRRLRDRLYVVTHALSAETTLAIREARRSRLPWLSAVLKFSEISSIKRRRRPPNPSTAPPSA